MGSREVADWEGKTATAYRAEEKTTNGKKLIYIYDKR